MMRQFSIRGAINPIYWSLFEKKKRLESIFQTLKIKWWEYTEEEFRYRHIGEERPIIYIKINSLK